MAVVAWAGLPSGWVAAVRTRCWGGRSGVGPSARGRVTRWWPSSEALALPHACRPPTPGHAHTLCLHGQLHALRRTKGPRS